MRPMSHLLTYVSGFCVSVYPCKLVSLSLLSLPSFSYREIQLLQVLKPISQIQKCMQYTFLTYIDTGEKLGRGWVPLGKSSQCQSHNIHAGFFMEGTSAF